MCFKYVHVHAADSFTAIMIFFGILAKNNKFQKRREQLSNANHLKVPETLDDYM